MPIEGPNKGATLGVRHLQVFLLFLAIVINFTQRLCVSISLVAMTNRNTTNPDFEEFNWNEKERSYVISSFYWTYFITQFPGAYWTRTMGVKVIMFIGTLCSSLLVLSVPFGVRRAGWKMYCVIRILQGLSQGTLFPVTIEHLAKWSPVEERTRLGAMAHLGMGFGTILAMGSGIIAGSELGWPGISYVFGTSGCVFCLLWLIFSDNSPAVSRSISSTEREYILSSQKQSGSVKVVPVPWKAIFTSVPFISLLLVRVVITWGLMTITAYIPAYMHGVLNMEIKSNAIFSALPYVAMFIFSIIYLILCDIILTHNWLSLNVVRKSVNTTATWIPAAMLVWIGFLDKTQKSLAIILVTLIVGFSGGHSIGSGLNTIDLSPNHAGVLTGINNGLANLVPIVSPIIVGIVVHDETQRSQWQIIFSMLALLYFVGNLQFIIFGSVNTQKWNDEDYLIKQREVKRN